ncbi:thioredoxin reductase [Rhizobium leguminosarum]|nr:thioredoxin reductase [Rhizobium leguminosarum]
MSFDVIIIGGNFAGLSAAMQLARARRRVLLVDAGAPRNRFSQASHGFLGQDGQTPVGDHAGGETAAFALSEHHHPRRQGHQGAERR